MAYTWVVALFLVWTMLVSLQVLVVVVPPSWLLVSSLVIPVVPTRSSSSTATRSRVLRTFKTSNMAPLYGACSSDGNEVNGQDDIDGRNTNINNINNTDDTTNSNTDDRTNNRNNTAALPMPPRLAVYQAYLATSAVEQRHRRLELDYLAELRHGDAEAIPHFRRLWFGERGEPMEEIIRRAWESMGHMEYVRTLCSCGFSNRSLYRYYCYYQCLYYK